VVIELLVLVNLTLVIHLRAHLPIPHLSIGLGISQLASFDHLGTLLDSVGSQDPVVSFLFQLIPVLADSVLLSDHSDAAVAFQTVVGDLRLEGEALDLL